MSFSENLKMLGKRSIDRITSAYYHHFSQKSAFQALAHIEKQQGKLSSVHKKMADEYADQVLGWKGYSPWLYVYTAVSGNFKEGWIPDNYYGHVVIPKIQGEYGKISFLKPLNNKIFNRKVSPDIAYFVNGQWFEKNFKPISRESLKVLISDGNGKVVYKVDQSYQGRGVFLHDRQGLGIELLEKKGNGTLQTFIEQHSFFDEFTSRATANIRLTTIITEDGIPSLRASYLRLGQVNDTHIQSNSHVRVPVELNTGNLHYEGFLANWEKITNHPASETAFSNKAIPYYQDCIKLVLELHKFMPMVKSIGWDVVVDKNNSPKVMEWNGYGNDIKFSEATQGPCFKDLKWDKLKLL